MKIKQKQITIVSGKGGTGKTTLSSALNFLFDNHIAVDCDVEAANLNLILQGKQLDEYPYVGGKKATINPDNCTECGVCEPTCRFDAIYHNEKGYFVDETACEGCGACAYICPVSTIDLNKVQAGNYFVSATDKFKVVHARLFPGEETSGGLVATVRKKAGEIAEAENKDYILIDGAPGIGCPATSSITGTSFAVLVTEPTVSGIHDLKRIIQTVQKFKIDFGVVINKFDINTDKSKEIEDYCKKENYKLIGRIPFDMELMEATMFGKSIIELEDNPASKAIVAIYDYLLENIQNYGG